MKKIILLTAFLLGTLLHSQTVDERIAQAQQYYDVNNHAYAKIELQKVLKIEPDNVAANYLMAKCLYKTRMFTKTDELLEKLLINDPSNVDYLWLQIRCNLTNHSTHHHFEKVIAILEKLQKLEGETGKIFEFKGMTYYHYGNYLYGSQKYGEALPLFELSANNFRKAVAMDPKKEPDLKAEIADADRYVIELKKKS